MSSLDTVEAVMAFEEAFGVELPVSQSGEFDSPREMVTGLIVTFQTNDQVKKPLRCSEGSPRLSTNPDWLKAWKAHGDENRLKR
jgi:hypothetical protein